MAKQTLTGGNGVSGQTGQQVIDMLNAMFTELYNQTHNRAHSITGGSDHSTPPEESWGLFLKSNKLTGGLEFSPITLADLPSGGGGGGSVVPTELKHAQYIELLDAGIITRRNRVTIYSSSIEVNEGVMQFIFDESYGIELGNGPTSYIISVEAVVEWPDNCVLITSRYHCGWDTEAYQLSELETLVTTLEGGTAPVFSLGILGTGLELILTTDGVDPIAVVRGEAKVTLWGHTLTLFQQS